MNDNAQLAEFANNLWRNYIKPKFRQEYHDIVTFYRAEVTANNGDGTLNIQRPFDNTITVPCTEDMSTVANHSQVTVLRFGNGNNSANQLVVAYGDGNPSYANLLRTVDVSTVTDANNALRMTIAYAHSTTVAQGIANLPTTSAGWLITYGRSSTARFQYYFSRGSNGTSNINYVRHYANNAWTDWEVIVPQTAETTWSLPTITNAYATITNGGYYTEGKRCYVQMRFTLASDLSANSGINIMSAFPIPKTVSSVVLPTMANNRGGHACRITSSGVLQVIADADHGITAGQYIDVTGVYTIQ